MNRHAKWLMGAIAAAAAVSSPGCATLQVRGARSPVPTSIYPAVGKDSQNIAACFTGATGFHQGGPLAMALGYTVAPLCWLLDMPLSAVTDTAWLAADLRAAKSGKVAPPEGLPQR